MGTRITKKELLFFIPFSILYGGSLFLKFHPELYTGWITNYVADILCIPIVLQLTIWILRLLKSDASIQLSKAQIWVAFVYVSLLFEVILPFLKDRYTADIIDVLMYAIGTMIYLGISKKIEFINRINIRRKIGTR